MRSTLFYIPHEFGPLTVFGFGWVLLGVILAWLAWFFSARSTLTSNEVRSSFTSWGLLAVVVVFLVPAIEQTISLDDGTVLTVGIPIRGYGLMLLLGIIAGCYWTFRRGHPNGLSLDMLFSLAFWGMIGGIGGARIFYVVQKWSELEGANVADKLLSALKFTEGGLVVYGGVIGGLLATFLWCYLRNRSFLHLADIVTPGFLIGLSIGRIGCLLNGCCYGGVCDTNLPAVYFPPGSPPFSDQLYNGQLLGVRLDDIDAKSRELAVTSVDANSWAAANDVKIGDTVRFDAYPNTNDLASPPDMMATIKGADGFRRIVALPKSSRAVHPVQIYATINAGILSLLLATLPFRYATRGRVFGAALILYGISRSLEEVIRVDELGQFGTMFSIGQWVSVIAILIGLGLLFYRTLNSSERPHQLELRSLG